MKYDFKTVEAKYQKENVGHIRLNNFLFPLVKLSCHIHSFLLKLDVFFPYPLILS